MEQQEHKQTVSFCFPTSLRELELVNSPQMARDILLEQSALSDVDKKSIRYRLQVQKRKYFYLRCGWRGCHACLIYKLSNQLTWNLTKSSCQHIHVLPQSKAIKFQAVKDYIDSLPSLLPPSTLKRVICPRFGITPKQLYYLLAKSKSKPIPPAELSQWLEERGFQVFLSNEERPLWSPPELLIACSREMKEKFSQFGDVVSFDLSFNLIKDDHPTGKKWKIGFFLGSSQCKHIVPFALVITLNNTKETYEQIFKTFFGAMEKQPKVLITDEERAIQASLSTLKINGEWEGIHLYDSYHILHNVRKKLSKKENIVMFSRLLHTRNNQEWSKYLSEVRERLPREDTSILDNFVNHSSLYCFSQIDPIFIGFSSSSSANQALHSLFKKWQPSQKQFSITIRNMAACASRLLQKCHQFEQDYTPYEKIFCLPELKAVRTVLSKPVMAKFVEELAKSLQAEFVDSGSDFVMILEHRRYFRVSQIEGKWICTCQYYQKSKLPCRHMLKVILVRGCSLMEHLSERWIATGDSPQTNKQKFKRGREKASRRKIFD